VESIASGQTFNGTARQGAQTFSHIVVCWTKNAAKILGEKLAQLVGCYCSDRLHGPPPRRRDGIILQRNWKAKDAGQHAPNRNAAVHSARLCRRRCLSAPTK